MKIKLLVLLLVVLAACNSDYTQKPRGYFKIDLPAHSYQRFDQPGFPYSFEYPAYGQIIKDSTFFEEKSENPYWINIDIPRFGARIYLSYKAVNPDNFDTLVNDAYKMSYKQHTYKASAIEPSPFRINNDVSGVYFTLRGNTATGNQFFATDSTQHFLRGALYFGTTPNQDSLKPVNDFLKKDIMHLIETIKWR